MKSLFKNLRKKEEGAVLVLVALLMTVLLGITALAVDFGLAFYQKQKLQAACDSAALAAATALPDTARARSLAYIYMEENGFSGNPADVIVEFEGTPISKVRVTQTYTMDTTFGRILGQDSIDVTCHAAAGGITQVINNGEFPYLIFAREGALFMGSQYYVAGSVHTNGTLKTSPGDGTGSYVQAMSYGDSYDISGHPCVEIDGEMYYVLTQLSTSDTRLYHNNQKSSTQDITWVVNTRAAESQTVETVQSWMSNLTLNEEGNPVKIYPIASILEQNDHIDEADSISGMTDDCEARIAALEATANVYLESVASENSAIWDVTTDTNYVNANHDNTSRNTILKTGNSWFSPGSNIYEHQEAVFAIKNTGSGPAKFGGSGGWPPGGSGYHFRDLVFYSTSPTRNSNYGAFYYTSGLDITANSIFSNDSMEIYAATRGDIVIDGNIYCNGDLYLYNCIVNGDIYATGSIKTENSSINGLFAADGDIYFGGVASSIDNITASNVNAMSIYSRNGNITTACQDSGALYLAGVMYAPNGNITINANLYFYGNVIGKTVDASSKTIHAFPFSDLVGSDTLEDVILPQSGDEVISDIVLVE